MVHIAVCCLVLFSYAALMDAGAMRGAAKSNNQTPKVSKIKMLYPEILYCQECTPGAEEEVDEYSLPRPHNTDMPPISNSEDVPSNSNKDQKSSGANINPAATISNSEDTAAPSNSAAKDPNENEDEDQENSANVNPAATTYKNAVAIAATAAGTAVAAYVVSALIGDDLWRTWTTPLEFSAQCRQTFAFCQSRHPKRKYCRLMNRLVEECEDVVPHAERVEMFKFYSETLNCTTPHEQRWFNLP